MSQSILLLWRNRNIATVFSKGNDKLVCPHSHNKMNKCIAYGESQSALLYIEEMYHSWKSAGSGSQKQSRPPLCRITTSNDTCSDCVSTCNQDAPLEIAFRPCVAHRKTSQEWSLSLTSMGSNKIAKMEQFDEKVPKKCLFWFTIYLIVHNLLHKKNKTPWHAALCFIQRLSFNLKF